MSNKDKDENKELFESTEETEEPTEEIEEPELEQQGTRTTGNRELLRAGAFRNGILGPQTIQDRRFLRLDRLDSGKLR